MVYFSFSETAMKDGRTFPSILSEPSSANEIRRRRIEEAYESSTVDPTDRPLARWIVDDESIHNSQHFYPSVIFQGSAYESWGISRIFQPTADKSKERAVVEDSSRSLPNK